jgi:RNA recognition motif-containing protein
LIASDFVFPDHVVLLSSENNFETFRSINNLIKTKKMNIYVANISFKTVDDELRDLFEQYGEVSSARIISDKFTGKSRGFGFVEMPDSAAAEKAIEEMNGYEFMTKVLVVNEAREREERPRNNYGGGSGGGGGYGGGGGGRRDGGSGGGGGYNKRY